MFINSLDNTSDTLHWHCDGWHALYPCSQPIHDIKRCKILLILHATIKFNFCLLGSPCSLSILLPFQCCLSEMGDTVSRDRLHFKLVCERFRQWLLATPDWMLDVKNIFILSHHTADYAYVNKSINGKSRNCSVGREYYWNYQHRWLFVIVSHTI